MFKFEKKAKRRFSYLSAKESSNISKKNRRITAEYEKENNRKNVQPEEYLTQMRDPNNVVEFDDLHTYFFTDAGTVHAVDGVSFDVPKGKTVGVVGESGCGKSVTSLSLMKLIQRPQGQITGGAIRFNEPKKKSKKEHLRCWNWLASPTSKGFTKCTPTNCPAACDSGL